jgi:cyclopropane fatty-acyl-phospholipid synthase-like methyltransferase
MDRAEISRIAHSDHPIAAPVSRSVARRLLTRLDPAPSGRVVDLGCGSGAWLLELLEGRPDLTAVGVDTALHPDREARALQRGVADRLTWLQADAATWAPVDGAPQDAVVCIGASHAFGGLHGTLDAIRRHLRAGGRALLGETIWEQQPSAAALKALDADPESFPTLSQLLSAIEHHGFEVGYAHVSTAEEWDDYEWSWTGSLVAWAHRHASTDAEREQALAAARAHRLSWIDGYRGELGFVTAVLHDIGSR